MKEPLLTNLWLFFNLCYEDYFHIFKKKIDDWVTNKGKEPLEFQDQEEA